MRVLNFAVLSLLRSAVEGFHPNDDIYYHTKSALGPSMWHFSADGLKIFSPEGNVLKAPPKSEICETYESVDHRANKTETVDSCRYFALSTDGHRYVWAGGRASSDRVEAFDIDTGERVGFTKTCRVPMDLGYHPGRREIFVHCHTAEIDVFSVHALGIDHGTISLGEGNPAGRVLVHSSLGSTGYSSHSQFSGLTEIDLASRKVKAFHPFPLANNTRGMAYSPVNRHVYVRPRHCCTCGFEGADAADCGGRWGPKDPEFVDILTGPSAGTRKQGVCGTSCGGTAADTVGIYEFDSVAKKIIGSFNIDPVDGFGAVPAVSPDGRYILMFGADGGKFVTVLAPGKNGESSTVVTKIPVDFKGEKGKVVISDFAFVSNNRRNILVLGASVDNDIVLIDLDDDFRLTKLALTNKPINSEDTSDRHLEWAVDTNYVWVTGSDSEELYVVELPSINIDDARVSKTVTGVSAGELIFANNYERKASLQAVTADGQSFVPVGAGLNTLEDGDDGNNDGFSMAIAAFLMALVSLLINFVLLVKAYSNNVENPTRASETKQIAHEDVFETESLGSKNVA